MNTQSLLARALLGAACIAASWFGAPGSAHAAVSVTATEPVMLEQAPAWVPTSGYRLALASSGSKWLALYTADYRVMARVLGADGSPLDAPFTAMALDRTVNSIDVVFDGTQFVSLVSSASDCASGPSQVDTAVFSSDGVVGDREMLSSFQYVSAGLATDGQGTTLVAFCEAEDWESPSQCSTYLRKNQTLTLVDTRPLRWAPKALRVAHSNGGWLLAAVYYDAPLALMRLDQDGKFLPAPASAPVPPLPIVNDARAIGTDSGYAVAWDLYGSIFVSDVAASGAVTTRPSALLSLDPEADYQWLDAWKTTSQGSLLSASTDVCDELACHPTTHLFELDHDALPVSPPTSLPMPGAASIGVGTSGSLLGWTDSFYGVARVQHMTLQPVATQGAAIDVSVGAADQGRASSGVAGDQWLVAWFEGTDARAAIVDADGQAGPAFLVRDASEYPQTVSVWGGADAWLVTWADSYGVTTEKRRRVSSDGQVSELPDWSSVKDLKLVGSNDGWLAVAQTLDTPASIIAQPIAPDGSLLPSFNLSGESEYLHGTSVVKAGDGFRAYWADKRVIWAQAIGADWTKSGDPQRVGSVDIISPSERFSVVASGDSTWLSWPDWNYRYSYVQLPPDQAYTRLDTQLTNLTVVNGLALCIDLPQRLVAMALPDQVFVDSEVPAPAYDSALSDELQGKVLMTFSEEVSVNGVKPSRIFISLVSTSGSDGGSGGSGAAGTGSPDGAAGASDGGAAPGGSGDAGSGGSAAPNAGGGSSGGSADPSGELGMPGDGGVAGETSDAGGRGDDGGSPTPVGCDCRAAGSAPGGTPSTFAAALLGLLALRRRLGFHGARSWRKCVPSEVKS